MSSELRPTPVSVPKGAGRLVQSVTGKISIEQYVRRLGECEIQRLSGDPQIRPETVRYVCDVGIKKSDIRYTMLIL